MPTTTRQAIRYPQATDAGQSLWLYWENLAKDVDAKAAHRGTGTALPASPVRGDRYYHTTYRCHMTYDGSDWRQDDVTRVADNSDRASFVAAVTAAGLTMHNGFQVFQSDTNQMWTSAGGTTLVNIPTYRGSGSAFPSSVQDGDTFYNTAYRSTFVREQGVWRQTTTAYVSSVADLGAMATTIANAGLSFPHNSFRAFETGGNVLYLSTGSSFDPVYGGDSGELSITFAVNWTKIVGTYRILGRRLEFTFQLTRASWTAGAALLTWPSGTRPTSNKWFTGMYQGAAYEVGVGTSGAMTVNNAGTGGLVCSGSWFLPG